SRIGDVRAHVAEVSDAIVVFIVGRTAHANERVGRGARAIVHRAIAHRAIAHRAVVGARVVGWRGSVTGGAMAEAKAPARCKQADDPRETPHGSIFSRRRTSQISVRGP